MVRKTRRVLPWLLAASLAVNAFLIALMMVTRHGPPGPPPGAPPPPAELIAHMTRHLPDADAAIFRDAMAPHMDRLRADHEKLRHLPDVLRAELAAETPDRARLRETFAELNAIRDYFSDAMVEATLEAAPRMSPEGREALWRLPPP